MDPIEEQGGMNLYSFVRNDGINWLDMLGRERIILDGYFRRQGELLWQNQLNRIIRFKAFCYEKLGEISLEIRDWMDYIDDTHTCCAEGKIARPEDSPELEKRCCPEGKTQVHISDFYGALTGDIHSTWGVSHCALGVAARERGVDRRCLEIANVYHETWEAVFLREWVPEWYPFEKEYGKKGPWGWFRETFFHDMPLVMRGYDAVSKKEDCIPDECEKTYPVSPG